MNVIRCNQPTFFDVDNTLVMWGYANVPGPNTVPITCGGLTQHLVPHKKHIEQLKAHAARGHTVFVWSKGGDLWAEAVVEALGLRPFVHHVLEKPEWYYDDIQAQDFMGKAIYLEDK